MSVPQVAAEANVETTTVYCRYGSKEELVAAAIHHAVDIGATQTPWHGPTNLLLLAALEIFLASALIVVLRQRTQTALIQPAHPERKHLVVKKPGPKAKANERQRLCCAEWV